MVLKTLVTGVGADEGNVRGIRSEELVLECVREIELKAVDLEVGDQEAVDEAVDLYAKSQADTLRSELPAA